MAYKKRQENFECQYCAGGAELGCARDCPKAAHNHYQPLCGHVAYAGYHIQSKWGRLEKLYKESKK